jgi:predicted nucleic acid-binding protein
MKTTADTSVLVAAFASWHEHHEIAFAAIGRIDAVVTHCLLETYSVLTRLPPPHRMAADVTAEYLERSFGRHAAIVLPAGDQRALVSRCASQGLSGGSVYDALIAATCAHAGLRLLTLDARARRTYLALAVDHELLA